MKTFAKKAVLKDFSKYLQPVACLEFTNEGGQLLTSKNLQ